MSEAQDSIWTMELVIFYCVYVPSEKKKRSSKNAFHEVRQECMESEQSQMTNVIWSQNSQNEPLESIQFSVPNNSQKLCFGVTAQLSAIAFPKEKKKKSPVEGVGLCSCWNLMIHSAVSDWSKWRDYYMVKIILTLKNSVQRHRNCRQIRKVIRMKAYIEVRRRDYHFGICSDENEETFLLQRKVMKQTYREKQKLENMWPQREQQKTSDGFLITGPTSVRLYFHEIS